MPRDVFDPGSGGGGNVTVLGGVTFRGAWLDDFAYKANDLVTMTGGTYIAVGPTTGNNPTTDDGSHWQIFASGIEGPQGPAGPRGDDGDPGPQGPAGEGGGGAEVVTTLPTTDLVDGRNIRLKITDGIYWDLMYDASIVDAYKWVAIATGRKLINGNATASHRTVVANYVPEDYGVLGPTLVVPEDGYYELTIAAEIWVVPTVSGVWEYLLSVTRTDNTLLARIGATEYAQGASVLLAGPTSLSRSEVAGGFATPIALTQGETLKWRHEGSHNVATAMRSRNRLIQLAPMRLG